MSQKERKKILVVDDEPLNCEMLQEFLSSSGYEVATALSGDEAIAAANKAQPDLVLLDIKMPGKSWLETLQELRTIAPEVQVIMVTGLRDEVLALEAEAEGAIGYVTKPVHLGHLMELITGLD